MCIMFKFYYLYLCYIKVFQLLHKSDYSSKKISKLNLIFMYYIIAFKYCQT